MKALQFIAPEVTVKGFSKCPTVNDTDDMLWNGSEEDPNVRTACGGDEGTDCEDGQSDTDW